MNHLQPPFNDIKMRQALLHLINQKAFQSLLAPNPKWFKVGGDLEKAKQLIAESGYAGEKVLILDPTDWRDGELASQLLADVLQKAGVNAELAHMAWSELAVRRGKKETVEDGGWSIFISGASDFTFGDPISAAFLQMTAKKVGTVGRRATSTRRSGPNGQMSKRLTSAGTGPRDAAYLVGSGRVCLPLPNLSLLRTEYIPAGYGQFSSAGSGTIEHAGGLSDGNVGLFAFLPIWLAPGDPAALPGSASPSTSSLPGGPAAIRHQTPEAEVAITKRRIT
ncbi:ABC transporter substrate-binding protein [Mesorhizobium sp. M0618]|uniref:ABC transporter substrate-binding protein n=1 Tax=unclassified Mesorhizobium TaxID=325217 RepID=UPI00333667C7